MKRNLLRILPLFVGAIAVGMLVFVRKDAPESAGAPAPTVEAVPAATAVHLEPDPEAGRVFLRSEPAPAAMRAPVEAGQGAVATQGPDWAQFLKRHAEGDPAAFQELLNGITPENALAVWDALRSAKLSPADRSLAYEALGTAGGGELVRELIARSDPDAALAVKGWGKSDPDGALDWFRQLDVFKDSQIQGYLKDSHLNEQAFLDRLAEGLLDSMLVLPDPSASEAARAAYATEAVRLVESFLETDSRKAEALMREVTERFLKLYDSDALSEWVNQMDHPVIHGAAIQRIIEAGAFDTAPFDAVNLALSLQEPTSRGHALSAAFGKLGAGVGGVDLNVIAEHLNTMPVGRDKDFAINGFAHGLVGVAPDSALDWARTVSNKGLRDTVVRNVSRRIEAQATQNRR